jgi:hypothetical protein
MNFLASLKLQDLRWLGQPVWHCHNLNTEGVPPRTEPAISHDDDMAGSVRVRSYAESRYREIS